VGLRAAAARGAGGGSLAAAAVRGTHGQREPGHGLAREPPVRARSDHGRGLRGAGLMPGAWRPLACPRGRFGRITIAPSLVLEPPAQPRAVTAARRPTRDDAWPSRFAFRKWESRSPRG